VYLPPIRGYSWQGVQGVPPISYTCSYCENLVSPGFGYISSSPSPARISICNHCLHPTYFFGALQIPGIPIGLPVKALAKDVETLYNEARHSAGSGYFTATVLLCRKILAHIAVDQGAQPNLTFQDYVDYLADNGFVPPKCKPLVDHIRKKGNEANHDIVLMNENGNVAQIHLRIPQYEPWRKNNPIRYG
jgi:Domain of unknown function (DUF4145)